MSEKPKRSSDTIRERMESVQPPMAANATMYPAAGVPGIIDPERLLKAWNANIDTMRELIRVVEKCEEDNRATRMSNMVTRITALAVLLVVLIVAAFIHVKGSELVALALRIEATTAGTNMDIRETAKGVALAVAKASEAQVLTDDIASRLNGPLYPPATAAQPDAMIVAMKARMDALAAALEVQAHAASEPSEKRAVKERQRALMKRVDDAALGDAGGL